MCPLCVLPRWLCDWSNAVCICGAGYDSIQPPVMNEGCYQSYPPRPISCHSFIARSTQMKRFLLSFLPPLEPSRGKSVELEVDKDKSTKGSGFSPRKWQLVCLLTPFSKSALSMFPRKKTSPGRVHAWQDRCTPISSAATEISALSKTWQYASSINDKRGLEHQQSPRATGHRPYFPRWGCKAAKQSKEGSHRESLSTEF